MRTEFFCTLEDGIFFRSMTLEKGTERLSRNVDKGSFLFLTLKVESKVCPKMSVKVLCGFWTFEGGIERLSRNVGKVSYWILDPCKWDRKVPKRR